MAPFAIGALGKREKAMIGLAVRNAVYKKPESASPNTESRIIQP